MARLVFILPALLVTIVTAQTPSLRRGADAMRVAVSAANQTAPTPASRPKGDVPVSAFALTDHELLMLKYTNQLRVDVGLTPLCLNIKLMKAARATARAQALCKSEDSAPDKCDHLHFDARLNAVKFDSGGGAILLYVAKKCGADEDCPKKLVQVIAGSDMYGSVVKREYSMVGMSLMLADDGWTYANEMIANSTTEGCMALPD